MTRYCYYTAATLDGFLADDQDSLDWLFKQHFDETGPGAALMREGAFGAQVMGATTYEWVLAHDDWTTSIPTFVFSHRELTPAADHVKIVSGYPSTHRFALEQVAGGKPIWVMGGGDLAAAFAAAGMLDEIIVSIAPVTLAAGRPLFGAAYDLRLESVDRNADFALVTYTVLGPLGTRP